MDLDNIYNILNLIIMVMFNILNIGVMVWIGGRLPIADIWIHNIAMAVGWVSDNVRALVPRREARLPQDCESVAISA